MGCTSATTAVVGQPGQIPTIVSTSDPLQITAEKVLPGKHSTERTMGEPKLNILDSDRLEEVAVVALWSQTHNYCYTDGTHNHNNYKVQRGTINGSVGFRVFPPESRAKKQLLSDHCLAFRPTEKSAYRVMMLTGQKTQQLATIKASDMQVGKFYLCREAVVSQLSKPAVYYLVNES